MTRDERYIARIIAKNRILQADGQAFEDIFTTIMNYSEPGFQKIKPWGNIGDRKNDGYIPQKGIFFQVFAPEDIEKKYPAVISKLKTDFNDLVEQWKPINEFYFVVNDKYKGINPDSAQTMTDIVKINKLQNGGFITAKDIENRLFTLADDQIEVITGSIPDPSKIKIIDYSILNEVITYIMGIPLVKSIEPDLKLPNWEEKIKFNHLSNITARYLENAYYQITNLEKYLTNNSDFLADELRNKMNEIYLKERETYTGDDLFWRIVESASPKNIDPYQSAVIVIMSKYFESCDIFEAPPGGEL